MRLDPWTVRLIVLAVVVGWLASLVASMVSAFEPPESLNALFVGLVGTALALRGGGNGNGNGGSHTKDKVNHE